MKVFKKRSLSLLVALAIIIQCIAGNAIFFNSEAGNVYAAESSTEEIYVPGSTEVFGVVSRKLDGFASEDEASSDEDWFEQGSGPVGDTAVKAHDWYIYGTRFFYQDLSEAQKKYYCDLYEYCMYFLTTADTNPEHPSNYKVKGIYVDGTLLYKATKEFSYVKYGLSLEDASEVVSIFAYENPQFYFLSYENFWNNTSIYLVFYDLFTDSISRANITEQMFSKIDNWAGQVAAESTPKNKIKKAQAIVSDNNEYGWSTYAQSKKVGPFDSSRTQYWTEYYDQSLYSAAMLRYTVCAGYTKLTTAILRKAGVNALSITSKGHAWNMVKAGANWYNLDVTWNDDKGAVGVYYPADYYFLISDENVKKNDGNSGSHTPNVFWTEFGKPVCYHDYSDSTYMTAGQSTDKKEIDVSGQFKNKWIPEVTPTVTLAASTFTYTGGAINPAITVRAGGYPVAAGNYEIIYPSGGFNVGDHELTVRLKSSSGYIGQANAAYKIIPKATTIKGKLKAGSGSFKISVKKVSKMASGYQVQYSLKKSFKGKKTVNLKGFKKTSKTIKGLKKKKKYYVRVRTYKTVDGEKYYSAWSKTKTVKTK